MFPIVKKGVNFKWILITAIVVLLSNLIQYIIFDQTKVEKKSETQNIYDIFTTYSDRVLSTYRFLIELEDDDRTPKEAYLFSEGFLMGISSDYYTKLDVLLEKMDGKEYNYELTNIVETNKNLQRMVYVLNKYLFSQQNNSEFPESWAEVKGSLMKIRPLLASSSTEDLTLYNITSYPREFITQPQYRDTMITVNRGISEVIDQMMKLGDSE